VHAYLFGPFEFLPDGTLLRDGKALDLPPKQSALLQVLAGAGGRLVSKSELMDRLWPGADVSEASLTTCVRGLRGALGDRGRRGGYLETVHGRGYRFYAAVRPERASAAPRVARVRVAVAPFACEGVTHRYLAEGVAGEVATSLQRWSHDGIDAIARRSAERGWQRGRGRTAFARSLDLDFVVEGRVWSGPREVRVSVALLRAGSRAPEWTAEFAAPARTTGLAAEIAEALAKRLIAPSNTGFEASAVLPLSTDPRAYNAVLRGFFENQYRDENGLRRSIACFEQAVRWDARCAVAHAALAEAYLHLGWRGFAAPSEIAPAAREALARALEIDPRAELAHAARAFLAAFVDRNPRAAQEALATAAMVAMARDRSAFFSALVHIAAGRTAEALRILERGLDLDPLSPNLAIARAHALYFAERYDEALAAARALSEAEPDFPAAQAIRADLAATAGHGEEALRCAERADALGRGDQMTRSACAWAFGQAGRPEAARAIVDAFERRGRSRYVSPTFVAVACAGLGDREGALRWLARAAEERCMWLALAARDPRLASLRDDPRFTAIVSARPARR